MSLILRELNRHAVTRPDAIALSDGHTQIRFGEIPKRLEALSMRLASGWGPVGLMIDNTPAWALLDLAAQRAQRPVLALPQFFSDSQLRHALISSGVSAVLTDDPERISRVMERHVSDPQGTSFAVAGHEYRLLRMCGMPEVSLPRDTAKITFTSGTTGEPKGVCLSQVHLDRVSASLAAAVAARPSDRHLSILPLATLLENIGGIYVPLLVGAHCELMPSVRLGLKGSSAFVAQTLLEVLDRSQPTSMILVPQLLESLVQVLESAGRAPPSLRFIAVGGAPVAASILERAAALNLCVHEGYGVSECASVLTLNPPGRQRPGSVGKPLAHVQMSFAADGEIVVENSLFLGYLGQAPTMPGNRYATGDTGYLDDDGYLYLSGRKKSMFVTAYGRNVAPEWIESELTAQPAIAQALVFGEAKPWNVAIIQPCAETDGQAIERALASVNRDLPDYAQIRTWARTLAPFTPGNGQLTVNGRLRRQVIQKQYAEQIQSLYS